MSRIQSGTLSPTLSELPAEHITAKPQVSTPADELQVVIPHLSAKNKLHLSEPENTIEDDYSIAPSVVLSDAPEAITETDNLAIVVTDNQNVAVEEVAQTVVDIATDAGVNETEMEEMVLVEVAVDENLNIVSESEAEKTVWLVLWGSVVEDMVYDDLTQSSAMETMALGEQYVPKTQAIDSVPVAETLADATLETPALLPLMIVVPNINTAAATDDSHLTSPLEEQAVTEALLPAVVSAQYIDIGADNRMGNSRSIANWLAVSLVSRQAWGALDRFFLNKQEND